jgi:diguanylate cyclase (GGDEF)-like protein/putative nucleotidyltransferase with HDIG domain
MPARIVEKLQTLPSLPQAASRLMQEVLKPDASMREVAHIIESDQGLVSRVLRLVNSPYYGVRNEITTTEHAVTMLGLKAIESLVLSLTVFDVLSPSKKHALDLVRHWQHSLAVAAASKYVAAKTGYKVPDEAYTAGLLHDVGRAILDICAPEELRQVLAALPRSGVLAVDIEREILGTDHTGVGELALRRWNIPAHVARGVGLHHTENLKGFDDKSAAALAAIVQAADFLAWANGLGSIEMPLKLASTPVVEKALQGIDQNEVFAEMSRELNSAAELFGVSVPDSDEMRRNLSMTATELGRIHTLHRDIEQRLARKTREVDAINILMRRVRHTYSKADVVKVLMDAVCKGLAYERAAYFDVDTETGELSGVAVADITAMPADISAVKMAAPKPESQLAQALVGGKPTLLLSGDGAEDLLSALDSSEAIVAPITAAKRIVGLIFADNYISKRPLTAADIVSISVLSEEAGLAMENAVLYEHAQRMRTMAETDGLTSLHNRRHIMHLLQNEIYRTERYKLPLSLVMIDIDRFKTFNDKYGHQAGDRVLRSFGKLLKKTSRNIDIPGRFGGEEFIVILPETGIEASGIYAERVRKLAERLGGRLKDRYPECAFTISVGLTSYNQESDDMSSFVHRVDQAMYAAKQRGRNRICAI